jgi:hypothetical protein
MRYFIYYFALVFYEFQIRDFFGTLMFKIGIINRLYYFITLINYKL